MSATSMFQADILPPMLPEPHPPLVQRGKFRHFDGTPAVFFDLASMRRCKDQRPKHQMQIVQFSQKCTKVVENMTKIDRIQPIHSIKLTIYFVINVSQLGWVCYFLKHPNIQFIERYCYQWYLATFKSGNWIYNGPSSRLKSALYI